MCDARVFMQSAAAKDRNRIENKKNFRKKNIQHGKMTNRNKLHNWF